MNAPSPSDARQYKPWPMWGKILAYLLMMALASASIWLIDRLAMQQAEHFNPGQPYSPAAWTK
jgi:hypothetical protein